ncbi:unnamed protein product [Prunus armeniaca]|uniref:Uncharacterized protein n=1 Tax=Prunus armeniaca TaxID=36596 RepID=A0A6J5X877_PRUAR|nr:unnamed protein product [Prunus armeniaca]
MTITRAKGSLGVKPPSVSFTEPRGHTEPPFEKGQGILLWHKRRNKALQFGIHLCSTTFGQSTCCVTKP